MSNDITNKVNLDFKSNPSDLSSSAKSIDNALSSIDRLCVRLCKKIQKDNAWGWPKLQHMRNLTSQADLFAAIFNLSQQETLLFKVVLRAHDIGRHLQALGETGRGHGKMSVELLQEYQILHSLEPFQRQAIYEAVQYHSERHVPLDLSKLGYKLCYCLRDLDKREIFEEDDIYFDPRGVWKEMKIHHLPVLLPDLPVDHISTVRSAKCEKLISKYWNESYKVQTSALVLTLEQSVLKVICGRVEKRTLDSFLNQNLPDSSWFKGESMATYVLYQVAQVFDVQSSAIKKEILYGNGLIWRLKFLKAKETVITYKKIIDTLDKFRIFSELSDDTCQLPRLIQGKGNF